MIALYFGKNKIIKFLGKLNCTKLLASKCATKMTQPCRKNVFKHFPLPAKIYL